MNLYLIQRAKIKKPLAKSSDRLSLAVSFDYMGSAEFEFGALPKSFRRFGAKSLDDCTVRLVPEIMDGESQLRVLSYLDTEQFREYKKLLIELRTSQKYTVRLKERSEFNLGEREPLAEAKPIRGRKRPTYVREYADFWWDITNDAMFSFNKNFMNRIQDYVNASLTYMDILS